MQDADASYAMSVSEIEVFERLQGDGYRSVLADEAVDLLEPGRGGRVVRFTSQNGYHGASSVLTAKRKTAWRPHRSSKEVQEIVFAFRNFALLSIQDIVLNWERPKRLPENWSPKVRVSLSDSLNPLAPYRDVGFLNYDGVSFSSRLVFPEHTGARYIKLTFSDPGAKSFGVEKVQVNGSFVNWHADSIELERHGNGGQWPTGSAAQTEKEQNNSIATATPLKQDTSMRGRSDTASDLDFFTFEVTGTMRKTVNFKLQGQPVIRTELTLLDSAHNKIFTYNPNGTEAEKNFTWQLEPGRYFIRLEEPATSIVLLIDDSSSMGRGIFTAMEAARLFALNKKPEERQALIRFSGSMDVLADLTTDGNVIGDSIQQGVNKGDGKGTSLYDAILLGRKVLDKASGNKAIVLITDGADTSSKIRYPDFWRKLETFHTPLYAIGLGKQMTRFNNKNGIVLGDMLQAFTLATGGRYFAAPQSDQLSDVYAEISRTLRARSEYEITYSVAAQTGQLQVLETGQKIISANQLGEIFIILDASGSMKAATDAGRYRIDVARTVLFDILHELPDDVPVGLGVYGHREPDRPKQTSCRDFQAVVAPAPNSRQKIIDTVRAIRPRGQTPIGYSLARASQSINERGRSLIIVLTDGQETCHTSPSAEYHPKQVADVLMMAGYNVRINMVGFDIKDPAVQDELARVAQVTGGSFYAGAGEAGLRTALNAAIEARFEIFDDLSQKVAEGKIGDGPVTLPVGTYRFNLVGGKVVTEMQTISEGRENRIYIRKEGEKIVTTSETVAPTAPLRADVRKRSRRNLTPEQQARLAALAVPEARFRPPQTQEEVIYKIQQLLNDFGFDPGPADGKFGNKTLTAIEQFLQKYRVLFPEYFKQSDASGNKPHFYPDGKPTPYLWHDLHIMHKTLILDEIMK